MPLPTDTFPSLHSCGGVQLVLYSSCPMFPGFMLRAHRFTDVRLARDPIILSPINALEKLLLCSVVPATFMLGTETFTSYPRKSELFVTVPDALYAVPSTWLPQLSCMPVLP